LIPTSQHQRSLAAARLAADTMGVPTVIVCRTDAESARLITSDVDARDRPFIEPGSRTPEGFFGIAAWPPVPSSSRRNSHRKRTGYTATRHLREVGTGYFDAVTVAVTGGAAWTTAMGASTETAQFKGKKPIAEAAE
jgi:isocitrate lyase